MISWNISYNEITLSVYQCTATRNTGNVVEKIWIERVFSKVLHDAFLLELSLGTNPSLSLFLISKAELRKWKCEYQDNNYGSWTIQSPKESFRIVYDYKNQYCRMDDLRGKEESTVWICKLGEIKTKSMEYIEKVISIKHL